jgi:hypothetical protein
MFCVVTAVTIRNDSVIDVWDHSRELDIGYCSFGTSYILFHSLRGVLVLANGFSLAKVTYGKFGKSVAFVVGVVSSINV